MKVIADNFKSHDSLKFCFDSIRDVRSNLLGCGPFLESNCPDILALCSFSVRGYFHLIRTDFVSHRNGLAVVKEEG